MDSSILTLKTALEGLTDYCQKWDPSAVSGSDAWGIAAVYQAANRLSDIFSATNPTLSSGWHNTGEAFYKLFEETMRVLETMYKEIELFTDETYQAELAAAAAVEKANNAATDILAELGL